MKDNPTNYILALTQSFPCLKRKVNIKACLEKSVHPEPSFDPDKFMAQLDCASDGELLCALFVVNVWNPGYAKQKGWVFNFFDFMGTADAGNREAFLAWAQNPVWP